MKKILLLFVSVMTAAVLFAQSEPTVSASSVTFKYCASTFGAENITIPSGQLPYPWNGELIAEFGTSVHTLTNARGCDSVITVTINDSKGAIPFAFSVSSTQKVYFSQGNLQYCAAPASGSTTHNVATGGTRQGVFRFANHQYDFVGNASVGMVYENNVKSNNLKYGEEYGGWIDLFPWGASGYNDYHPYGTSSYGSYPIDYSNNTKYYDWGMFNAISNGGNMPGKWFMLNPTQWDYLLNKRTDAVKKVAYATVAGVQGTILLPDTWVLPKGLSFDYEEGTSVNVYTAKQWKLMEANGAVFLVKCGNVYRNSGNYYNPTWNAEGHYWTPTNNVGNSSYRSTINSLIDYSLNNNKKSYYTGGMDANYRCAVRLVRYTTTTF